MSDDIRTYMNIVNQDKVKVFRVYFRAHAYFIDTWREDPWHLPEEITVGHTTKPHKAEKMKRWAVKKRLEIDKHIGGFYTGDLDDQPKWEQNTIVELNKYAEIETIIMDKYSDSEHFDSDQYLI